eukprot:TRINITY_DN60_c0_g1_i1.p1 TRINITY_DN60_c0_g1~~TRINITY_DN60_c0_g1_i1.p1  ORF type:complete len:153 (+),score=58.13 TRINITY_DN60_c0_g1_i1:137-595(+)
MDLWQNVTSDQSEINWCILGVENDEVVGVAEGTGIESLTAGFADDQIQWGVIRVEGVDSRGGLESRRAKYVQINWVGPSVTPMRKMKALSGKDLITAFLGSVGLTVDARDRDDIEVVDIAKSLIGAGGAHKPTYYDFGDAQVQLSDLGFETD